MHKTRKISPFLKHLPFLQGLDPELITKMAEQCEILKFSAHSDIFKSLQSKNDIYLIYKGICKLIVKRNSKKYFIIDCFQDKDILSSHFFPLKHAQIQLQSMQRVEICVIPHKIFFTILTAHPKHLQKFLSLIIQRTIATHKLLFSQVFCTNTGKIAETILRLAEHFGRKYEKYTVIDFPITHRELGAFVGTSREATTKIIGELKRSDAIAYLDQKIVILDQSKLKKWTRQ